MGFPGLPGGFGIYQGKPSICPNRTPVKKIDFSRGTFPILSRGPSFQETIQPPWGKQPVFEKNRTPVLRQNLVAPSHNLSFSPCVEWFPFNPLEVKNFQRGI